MEEQRAEYARQERREWFDEYLSSNEGKAEVVAAGLPLPISTCPCCGFPTLGERHTWEICWLCWWEDDGQDDPGASAVVGGPNGRLSLLQARKKFASEHVKNPNNKHAETARQTKAREDGIVAYEHLRDAESEARVALWREVDRLERGYFPAARSVTPEIRAEIERRAQAKESPP